MAHPRPKSSPLVPRGAVGKGLDDSEGEYAAIEGRGGKKPWDNLRYPSAAASSSLAITFPNVDSISHHFLSFTPLKPFTGRMAPHLLLAVWLATVCALAQPQPPGTSDSDFDLPPPDLPLPLIHFKLGENRNIISSTKKTKSWNSFYTTGSTNSGEEPSTSNIPVVSANGTTLPSYDTVVRLPAALQK